MFPGLGTIVNTLAVLVAGTAGSFVHGAIPERFHRSATTALGLGVIFIGASQCLQGLSKLSAAKGAIGTTSLLIFAGSLIVGALIGEALKLEGRLEGLGHRINYALQKRKGVLARLGAIGGSDTDFVEAFMTATLIYCVGAMTVLGSIQDGLGMPQTLFVKALLDGVISVFLASSLGIGVSFAAIPVLVLQGALALAAHWVGPLIPQLSLMGLEAVGGVLIAGIGVNLVFNKKLPVGNMLPSVFLAMAVIWIMV